VHEAKQASEEEVDVPLTEFSPHRRQSDAGPQGEERAIAYEEIRQLAARYALALGHCDLAALVELYVPDIIVAEGVQGREALARHFDRALRAFDVHFVLVGTHVINLQTATQATGIVYSLAEFGDADKWYRQALAYEDHYERCEGRWYFSRRRDHQLFYGCDTGLRPLAQPPANWPERVLGKGTIPETWLSWQEYHGAS